MLPLADIANNPVSQILIFSLWDSSHSHGDLTRPNHHTGTRDSGCPLCPRRWNRLQQCADAWQTKSVLLSYYVYNSRFADGIILTGHTIAWRSRALDYGYGKWPQFPPTSSIVSIPVNYVYQGVRLQNNLCTPVGLCPGIPVGPGFSCVLGRWFDYCFYFGGWFC